MSDVPFSVDSVEAFLVSRADRLREAGRTKEAYELRKAASDMRKEWEMPRDYGYYLNIDGESAELSENIIHAALLSDIDQQHKESNDVDDPDKRKGNTVSLGYIEIGEKEQSRTVNSATYTPTQVGEALARFIERAVRTAVEND